MSDEPVEALRHSFIQHLHQFSESLPQEERALLGELVLRAAQAPPAGDEVSGYAISSTGVLTNQFFSALITEVGFPALDASSKDAAKMSIKFAPEWTQSPRH